MTRALVQRNVGWFFFFGKEDEPDLQEVAGCSSVHLEESPGGSDAQPQTCPVSILCPLCAFSTFFFFFFFFPSPANPACR